MNITFLFYFLVLGWQKYTFFLSFFQMFVFTFSKWGKNINVESRIIFPNEFPEIWVF